MLPAKVDHPFAGINEPKRHSHSRSREERGTEPKREDVHDILPLFRLLLESPPPEHVCKMCLICRITEL